MQCRMQALSSKKFDFDRRVDVILGPYVLLKYLTIPLGVAFLITEDSPHGLTGGRLAFGQCFKAVQDTSPRLRQLMLEAVWDSSQFLSGSVHAAKELPAPASMRDIARGPTPCGCPNAAWDRSRSAQALA